jgi:hypothetical protein
MQTMGNVYSRHKARAKVRSAGITLDGQFIASAPLFESPRASQDEETFHIWKAAYEKGLAEGL